MKLPEPTHKIYADLLSLIRTGEIKIPQFQRNFVWSKIASAKLIDSVIKGYPIGTFIFWRTAERLRSVRDLGGHELPSPKKGEKIDYVLDGQQRLTSLYAGLNGLTVERDGREEDFSTIHVNLDAEEYEEIVVAQKVTDNECVPLNELLKIEKSGELHARFPDYKEKITKYQMHMISYQFSVIRINDVSINVATDIFTRVNIGGKVLSLFEIMVAKTYDDEKKFDLAEKYTEFKKVLASQDYGTIPSITVLQTVSMIMCGECDRKAILNLNKTKFIDTWSPTINAIKSAIEFFKTKYRIPVSRLLPYNALVVLFAYYFYKTNRNPEATHFDYMQDFFWRCSLASRYSSAADTKLAQDRKRIDSILANILPQYDWSVDTTPDFIMDHGWFTASRAYIKALLCIYAYFQPESFNDHGKVIMHNQWLQRANSRNYHHFFPKKYLDGKKFKWYANHIANITIVDEHSNKHIGANPPAKYMKEFEANNTKIIATMKSHLIGDLDKFGVRTNDYDTFVIQRAKLISKEIENRIINQKIDNEPQTEVDDDYDDDAE